jgi:TATA-box binding protein (TBP) (component of TFIID and TFIIIB)
MSEENINDAWTKFNLYGSFEMEKTSTSASSAPAKGEYTNSSYKDGTSCSFDNGENTASIFERDQPTERAPDSSPLCISTKTKIAFLNTDNIDICLLFWAVPIHPYYLPGEGIIKKQIKVSCHSQEETDEIDCEISKVNDKNEYCEETIIDNINTIDINTPGSNGKYKMSRKISIGVCKKSIANQSNKQKRAFFNCIVLILRIHMEEDQVPYKEIHVKIFNTGKMEIPGVQSEEMYKLVIDLIIKTLSSCNIYGSEGVPLVCHEEKTETVLINSNFNCGFYINRDEMYSILKYKYRMHCNFDSCSYPGIQCKFYYDTSMDSSESQSGVLPKHKNYLEISFMIFRTGSVLIVGKCESDVLYKIYEKIKWILTEEYKEIYNSNIQSCDKFVKKEKVVKYKTVYIYKEEYQT